MASAVYPGHTNIVPRLPAVARPADIAPRISCGVLRLYALGTIGHHTNGLPCSLSDRPEEDRMSKADILNHKSDSGLRECHTRHTLSYERVNNVIKDCSENKIICSEYNEMNGFKSNEIRGNIQVMLLSRSGAVEKITSLHCRRHVDSGPYSVA